VKTRRPRTSSAKTPQIRILCVEDELDTARLLREALRANGYGVRVAKTGGAALTASVTTRDIERGRKAGFDDYLSTPVRINDVPNFIKGAMAAGA